jgi:hypothetical protein
LLFSTTDAALRVAITETISRYTAPSASAAALVQPGEDEEKRGCLLEEDFS